MAGLAIVVSGIAVRFNDTAKAAQWSEARSTPAVHLVNVRPAADAGLLALPGTMQAWQDAHLFARVSGYVLSWNKDIGARVAAGTPLGQIETPELDQQINQARAALSRARASAVLARSTARRWNDLLADHSVSQQEADEKNGALAVDEAAVKGAAADLNRLLAQKAYATVRAPFAGIVTARNADIGDLVGPGTSTQQPMFSVADPSRIRLYVSVPQGYSAAMAPGLVATLAVPELPGQTFPARLVGTAQAIDPKTGTLQVELVADNPGLALKPGGFAKVTFSLPGRTGAAAIPASAMVFRASGPQVATVDSHGRVHLHTIAIGRDLGSTVEVLSGIAPGTRIIDNPPDSIADGELVSVGKSSHD
ncbi:MAG TPA: efflux RND transporter periplasmic adaptor subunit [Novosphingobium sp.]